MKYIILITILSFTYFKVTEARPVSYPGGITLMLMNDSMKNSLHAHYSPSAQTSFGYKFEYWRSNEFSLKYDPNE